MFFISGSPKKQMQTRSEVGRPPECPDYPAHKEAWWKSLCSCPPHLARLTASIQICIPCERHESPKANPTSPKRLSGDSLVTTNHVSAHSCRKVCLVPRALAKDAEQSPDQLQATILTAEIAPNYALEGNLTFWKISMTDMDVSSPTTHNNSLGRQGSAGPCRSRKKEIHLRPCPIIPF